MRPESYEAREPMNRCNRQLPSQIVPAIVVRGRSQMTSSA